MWQKPNGYIIVRVVGWRDGKPNAWRQQTSVFYTEETEALHDLPDARRDSNGNPAKYDSVRLVSGRVANEYRLYECKLGYSTDYLSVIPETSKPSWL